MLCWILCLNFFLAQEAGYDDGIVYRDNRGQRRFALRLPVLTADLVLSHFESAAAHETGTVINNLPCEGETVTVTDVEGFYPRLLCSNPARTYSEMLDSLARALGCVRLEAVFRDGDGQPFVHSRVQTADGRPYYRRQKGVSSARGSYLLLPAGRPGRGEPLVVCEGEKAAAAAMSAGFAGACWSGGSGAAGTINVEEVSGVDVVLVSGQRPRRHKGDARHRQHD